MQKKHIFYFISVKFIKLLFKQRKVAEKLRF